MAPDEQPRSDASTLKPILMAVALLALLSVALDSAILAKGLRGGFATTVADGSLGSTLPGAISGGGAPPMTEGSCMLDVQLQAQGETPVGVPTDWHPDNNIIVKVRNIHKLCSGTCNGPLCVLDFQKLTFCLDPFHHFDSSLIHPVM